MSSRLWDIIGININGRKKSPARVVPTDQDMHIFTWYRLVAFRAEGAPDTIQPLDPDVVDCIQQIKDAKKRVILVLTGESFNPAKPADPNRWAEQVQRYTEDLVDSLPDCWEIGNEPDDTGTGPASALTTSMPCTATSWTSARRSSGPQTRTPRA
jgi:hypothetical protein